MSKTNQEILQALSAKIKTEVRTGKGGTAQEYIPVETVVKRLNEVFNIEWNFEVVREVVEKGEVAVLVRVHYPTADGQIKHKDAWGGHQRFSDVGDALKAATSKGLTKAASLIGIVVPKDDGSPITEDQKNEIIRLVKALKLNLSEEKVQAILAMSAFEAESLIEGLQEKLAQAA